MPVTGITLPFVSYGGSSLVASFMAGRIITQHRAKPPNGHGARIIRVQLNISRKSGSINGWCDTLCEGPTQGGF